MRALSFRRAIAWFVMLVLNVTQVTQVAALTISNIPLAAATTNTVRPNLMYVLDDSGSMAWDYTPDYINDSTTAADPGSQGGSVGDGATAYISGGAVTNICSAGQPIGTCNTGWGSVYRLGAPSVVIVGGGGTGAAATVNLNTSTFKITSITVTNGGSGYTSAPYVVLVGGLPNATWGMCWGTTANNAGGTPKDTTQSPTCTSTTQIPYATSAINYQYYDAAVRYDVPLKADGSGYANATPTAAKSDGFTGSTTKDLTNAFTHEVWCNTSTASPSAADPTAAGKCRENGDTTGNVLYPDAVFTYRKTYSGPAFYYRMNTSEYCTDDNYTDCKTAAEVVANGGTVFGGVSYNTPSKYRWCAFYNPQSKSFGNCQGHRDLSHYIPNYLGGWVSGGTTGLPASTTLTVNSVAAGKYLNTISVNGTNLFAGPITADGASTTSSIAGQICTAIQATASTTGYNCAPAGSSLQIQSVIYGDLSPAPSVLVDVPTAVASNAEGSFQVNSLGFLLGSQIDSITVGVGGNELLNASVAAIGDYEVTAAALCTGINSGPNQALYIARAPAASADGTCSAINGGVVVVKRLLTDDSDNGKSFVFTGPSGNVGSIVVNPTGGATRIGSGTVNALTLNGAALLGSDLTFADGTLTSTIATSLNAALLGAGLAGCTTTVVGNRINLSGPCTGSLANGTAASSATGVFRVSALGSTSAGDLGGIQVGGTDIVGHVTSGQITNGNSVSANATTLQTLLNAATSVTSGGVGPHGFTAAAPVLNGSNYDITVTAPAGNAYNGASFTFFNGTTGAGAAGTSPSWSFRISDATADSATLSAIQCGATHMITQNTANTGAGSSLDYLINLSVNSTTNGLNGRSYNGYTYACTTPTTGSPTSHCTITKSGAPGCTDFDSPNVDSGITLTTPTLTQTGTTASDPEWSFDVTGASADNAQITAITCGGHALLDNAVNTGTATVNWASALAYDIETKAEAGTGDWSTSTTAQRCTTPTTTSVNCRICQDSGKQCSGSTASVTSSSGGVTIGAVTETYQFLGGANRYCYNFTVSGVDAANEKISVACDGDTAVNNASSGSTSPDVVQRITTLVENNGSNDLESADASGWPINCTTPTTAQPYSTCTVTGPSGTAPCSTLSFTKDASITIANNVQVSAGGVSSDSIWEFDITGATTASAEINRLRCAGTSTFNESFDPSAGTAGSTANWERINNLTQGGTGLNSLGTNGYTVGCTVASSGTAYSDCTITGPTGATACGTAPYLTFTKDASITVGTITELSAGSNAGTASVDFAPALSQVSAFSTASAKQGLTLTGMTVMSTTSTTVLTSMGGGSALDPLALDITPRSTTLTGGQDPDTSSNHWTNVGLFQRVDVVPTNNSYNRASGRTDCVAATCTYNEEMQNFANWYSYYRTRMLMMKSATTLAFDPLDANYRVGFDNICQATGTTVDRGVAGFADDDDVTNHRSDWWSSLLAASPSCATPLRAETAKIGRYFAGKLSGTDPIEASCQQNYMILVTDGYWNETDSTSIKGADNADIGNRDNSISTAARPYYDGEQATTSCPLVGSTRSAASSCRTLADIAWYFYSTDLRDGALSNTSNGTIDVSANNVFTTDDDKNTAQHMNFYAIGLGIDGTLRFRSDYQTATTGIYANILSGSANWPAVSNLDPTGVDDLWHATVNGRGKYFSARNVPAVIAGLREALTKIGSRVGSAAAAATSNLEPVSGDNYAYVASYATNNWTGDLQSRSIDLNSGEVSASTACTTTGSGCQWSAQQKLDSMTWSARRIYAQPTSRVSGDALRLLNGTGVLTAAETTYMDPSSLSQYATLSVSNAADITADTLMEYLRGNRGLEQDGNIVHAQIYRKRVNVLGDIVNTQPVFSKAPTRAYTDAGYDSFKSVGTAAARKPIVVVSAQDGMLHAFNANTAAVTVGSASVLPGQEMWAYIPQLSMSRMRILADVNYTVNHKYFIDGPITIADVNFGGGDSDWHTILVAGLGAGGKSYFALDITDPTSPKFLWEVSPSTTNTTTTGFGNLGYAFSNPVVSKLPSGEWAVFFSSGYNNADGVGYLYAVNPKTGAVKTGFPLSTGSGTGLAPSNLGKISVWVDDPVKDNTAQYIYAGDMNGDVWRFDLDPFATGHSGQSVFKLAHLEGSDGFAQPITTKLELTTAPNGAHVVYVGTGRYLQKADPSDLENTDIQNFYAIKDTLGAENLIAGSPQQPWNPQNDLLPSDATKPMFLRRKFIAVDTDGNDISYQNALGETVLGRKICAGASATVVASGTAPSKTYACSGEDTTEMDWEIYGGWVADFSDTGERMNVDMKLVKGTLVIPTNVPGATTCSVAGDSYISFLDYATGLSLEDFVSRRITGALIVGVTVVKLQSGDYKAIVTLSNYQTETVDVPVAPPTAAGFLGKRGLWREFEPF